MKIEEIKKLEKELEKSGSRMAEYRKNGNYEQEASEHAYYNEVIEKMDKLLEDKEGIANEIKDEISKLQEELKDIAERMEEYKNYGFHEQEAAEHKNYNDMVKKIQEFEKELEKIEKSIKKEKEQSNKKKETKWHPDLTPEQIEELEAEGIEPGDNEYTMYLRNHGINPNENKAKKEEVNKKKEIKWHSLLTPEQIDELKAEGIEPGDNEYRMYLLNHGINPNEKEGEKEEKESDKDKETGKDDKGNISLDEYNKMLEIYNEDLETLYELQQKYERQEIDYADYEKHADYMVERYRFMMEAYKNVANKDNKEIEFRGITDDDLKAKLDELNAELADEWNFRAHQENGMEEHQDDKLNEIQAEIDKIKVELEERKDNPLRGFSDQELEAKKKELYAKIVDPNEYHFRAHQENGMEGYEEDEIDKGLKEIQKEIERRAKEKEEPEKPEKPMMIEKDKEQDDDNLTTVTKGMELQKSGLQIFREQFNQMPEIEKRHTLSERYDIVMPLGIPAAAALTAFVNPLLGIPVIAGTAIAKPIIYRMTGQKKLEDEIKNQFLDMDKEEFDRMVDYLAEEKQADLKPNAVILNALHKAMIKRTKDDKKMLDEELESLQEERDEILAKGDNITEAEKQRLGQILDRTVSITDHTTLYDANGKEVRGPSESDKVSRRLKEVRRGKDRISAKYKGNIASKFNILNIFSKRNSTTKEYAGPLNEYADAEKERDFAIAEGDNEKANKAQKSMEQIMKDNTYSNALGIQKSVFNDRKGAVKIISDAKDKTVQWVATMATIGIGLTKSIMDKFQADKINEANRQKFENLQNQHNNDVDNIQQATQRLNQNEIQTAADGQVTQAGTAAEHANLNKYGDFTQGYRSDDLNAQNMVNNMAKNSNVNAGKESDMLHRLADIIRSKGGAAQDLVNSTNNPVMSGNTLNSHNTLLGYEANYSGQVDAEANIIDKCADVIEYGTQMQKNTDMFQNVQNSLLGPIILAVGGFAGKVRSSLENRKNAKENKEINGGSGEYNQDTRRSKKTSSKKDGKETNNKSEEYEQETRESNEVSSEEADQEIEI